MAGFEVITEVERTRVLSAGAAALIIVALAYLTVRQQQFYRNYEAFYQRALQVDPTNVLVLDYLGDAYLEQREYDRAMFCFRESSKLEPDNFNVKLALARGLYKTGQYDAAEPALREVVDQAQGISRGLQSALLLAVANSQVKLGKLETAEVTLRELEGFNPVFPGLHRTRAVLFQTEGRLPEAQREYSTEFRVSGDKEARAQAVALARLLASKDSSMGRDSSGSREK